MRNFTVIITKPNKDQYTFNVQSPTIVGAMIATSLDIMSSPNSETQIVETTQMESDAIHKYFKPVRKN